MKTLNSRAGLRWLNGWLLGAVLVLSSVLGFAANPFENASPAVPVSEIDRLVARRLQKLNLEPAAPCSDAVFVRRVYLDVIGTLPTAAEARDFILDRKPDKRAVLIDRLMTRDEFTDYWANKWCDLLRVKAEFPVNLWPNAAQAYHHWLHASLQDNKPYDQFVRELLVANGSNFREAPVNFYRAMPSKDPPGIARMVALNFMGVRAEKWPTNQLAQMAAFFAQVGYKSTSEWKEEIVFNDPAATNAALYLGPARKATFPDGQNVVIPADKDPREVFADWLIRPKNKWFTRNIANRTWSWLLGRGIIHEPDDIRPDNPPSNPELLAYLERELIDSNYDLKKLFRLILNSQTYQRSSLMTGESPDAAANFASYPLRRLDAEVLIDAINQLTTSSEKYSSAIPEPFTFIPDGSRAIALPDGSITSPFLEQFGRPPRDTGLESERNNRFTASQRLHLLNSTQVQRKLEQSRMVEFQSQGKRPPREIATNLYLGILSRYPTEEELVAAESYAKSGKVKPREAIIDVAWALMNSAEFLHRH
ncbi:MAG: hypothetical protein RLY20_847 [Verrucomicrobiota bacterium]|jgi:hypothetical protein